VWKGWEKPLRRYVAIKFLQGGDPVDLKRFEREALTVARLNHPNIAQVYEFATEGGRVYLAMQLVHGTTIDRAKLDEKAAMRAVRDVAAALDYAHKQGVIHRDIKPANIMVLDSGDPKIMDFGIAKIETARLKLTQGGQFFGTPLYMAPEQALGHGVDGRADLFSLGAITYQLLTGRQAFAAENIPRILARIVQEDPLPPSRVVAGLPADVDYLIARALAKSPADRYPDGRTLAEDVDDVLAARPARHRTGWRSPAPAYAGADRTAELEELALHEVGAGTETEERDLDAELETLVSPPTVRDAAAQPPPLPTVSAPPSVPPVPSVTTPPTAPHPAPADVTRVAAPVPRQVPSRRRASRWPIAGAAIPVAAALVYVFFRQPSPPAAPATTAPVAEAPSTGRSASPTFPSREPPSPTAEPAPPPTDAARLVIDLEHPLKRGTLSIWLDDTLVVTETLDSRVTKKILVFESRKGSFQEDLEVPPGPHEIRVQVRWNRSEKTDRIQGRFEPGQTRRLEIRMGRLRKNLSLDWR
jgi:serine/threonine-protein kinase